MEIRNIPVRLAASALVIGLTTVGCQGDDIRPAAWSAEAPKGDRDAFRLFQQAQLVAQKGDNAEALELMERAVEMAPRDAGYRMGLAELYLRTGRFASAERTFSDVIILNPDNIHAGLYLGLSRAAQGESLAALAALEKLEGRANPDDLGLAYALAGNPQRAVTLLEEAARAERADGRVRQNLALAHAMAGDWGKARTIAAQDISPAELGRRMEKWAALAAPADRGAQVAAFFGVTPAADTGQPVRLALRVPQEEAPARAEAIVEAPPAPEAALAAAAPASDPVADATPAPMQVASYVMPAAQPVSLPAPLEAPKSAKAVAPVQRSAVLPSSQFVMQIGAFSSRAQAEAAWRAAQKRFGFSSERQVVTTVIGEGKGVFHRLAVKGFATSSDANRACKAVKAKGGECFVRSLATRPATKIAARR